MSSKKEQIKSVHPSTEHATEHTAQHPAVLYIGYDKSVIAAVEERLVLALCAQQGCKNCASCRLILERQHYSVTWLTRPEKWYSRSDMVPIFQKAQFTLAENEHHFFVIERADLMNASAANSLLKLLEEPPRGYQFLLGSSHAHAVLPTVRSRCLVRLCTTETPVAWEQLRTLFTEKPDLNRFMSLLEDRSSELHTVHESQALDLIDQVYGYWAKRMIDTSDSDVQARIRVLDHARCFPPMPGSTVLFLKNLFLQLFMRRPQEHCLRPGTYRRLFTGRYVPSCPFISD